MVTDTPPSDNGRLPFEKSEEAQVRAALANPVPKIERKPADAIAG
jgi:hypothetical protein